MSALREGGLPAAAAGEQDRCARCGATLEPDQEWCLECGGARTVVHRPPDLRVGAAIVGTVVLASLVALAIVLLNLSTAANRELPITAARSAVAAGRAAAVSPAPAPVSIADWPVGLSGWTVVLGRRRTQPRALTLARSLIGRGLSIGILNSGEHPRLQAGYFVVFSGRYPTKGAALAAAGALRRRGQPQALARQVAQPGGL